MAGPPPVTSHTPANGGTRSRRLFPAAQQPGQRRSPSAAWWQLKAAPRRRAQQPCQAGPSLGGGAPPPARHALAATCTRQRPLASGSGAGSQHLSSPACCDLSAGSLRTGSRGSQTRERPCPWLAGGARGSSSGPCAQPLCRQLAPVFRVHAPHLPPPLCNITLSCAGLSSIFSGPSCPVPAASPFHDGPGNVGRPKAESLAEPHASLSG